MNGILTRSPFQIDLAGWLDCWTTAITIDGLLHHGHREGGKEEEEVKKVMVDPVVKSENKLIP